MSSCPYCSDKDDELRKLRALARHAKEALPLLAGKSEGHPGGTDGAHENLYGSIEAYEAMHGNIAVDWRADV